MATTIQVPIVQRRQVQDGIVEYTCQLNRDTFPFKAGQHFQVTLPSLSFQDSKGNTRTFNILSSPNNTDYISFAFVDSDSAFKKTINEMPINSTIQIKGPFGMFTLPSGRDDVVFISEGVGIVPIISMLLYLTEEKLSNKITVIHSGKNQIPYNDDLNELQKINPKISIKTQSGLLDSDYIKKHILSFENVLFYVAGTSQMVSKIKPILLQNNVPQTNIKTEEFTGY